MPIKKNGQLGEANEQALARSFNHDARWYDSFRQGYPETIFDTLSEQAELTTGAKVLEIGCGTGKATVPLVERGYDVTAVEPGENLVAVAEEKLQAHPNAKIITGAFEEIELPNERFDLVVAAMSLHWVREDVRFKKPHQLLKPGGHLAILYNWPLADEAVDPFYEALNTAAMHNGLSEGSFPPIEQDKLAINPPVDQSLFGTPNFFIHRTTHTYESGAEYANFLATLSGVSTLPEEQRDRFLNDMAKLIEDEFNNRLELPFASTLAVAQKK